MAAETTFRPDERRRKIMGNYIPDYLVFRAREAGTFTLTIGSNVPAALYSWVAYSLDGRSWVTTQNVTGSTVTVTTPTIQAGKKVYWKGDGYRMTYDRNTNGRSTFSSTGNFDVEGNIMSLLYGDDFSGKVSFKDTSGSGVTGNNLIPFYALFDAGKKIIEAGNLILPATSLVSRCYQEMFYNCSNMISAPQLPATTIVYSCYSNMFNGCSSLTRAPELPAETLESQCYYQMFRGCSSLNYLKAMFTSSLTVSQALSNWVYGVNGSGTFVKNANATWENTFGASAIPTNFTVILN